MHFYLIRIGPFSIRVVASLELTLGLLAKDASAAVARSLTALDCSIGDGMATCATTSSTPFERTRPTLACLSDSLP